MKKMKKLFCAALAAAMLMATMSGCGSSQNRLEKILESGKLVLATSPDFAPLEFEDLSSGEAQYVGSDIELAKYIAEKLGVELEISAMDFSAVQAAIPSGQADIAISGFAKTEERAQNMELSTPFNITEDGGQTVLVAKGQGANYTAAEDFSGLQIGAQNGSLQYNLVSSQLPEDVEIVPVGSLNDGVLMLETGKIDALASDLSNAELLLESHDGIETTDFMFEYSSEGNVAAVKKGETELIEAVNEIIEEVNELGLYDQWKEEATELAKSLGLEVNE
jgi:polar amino acid transport system substrate-binding protein